ncbi:MAG: LLM class flavin-dependent oxidoreductase, partial [Nitrososphaerales archaeon]
MKFGVRLPVSGPIASADSIVQTGLAAERLGFDFVTVHDHIERGFHERYHFAVGTVEAVDSSKEVTNFFESIATLSFLAGMTKRIRFVPAALVLPVRN